MEDPDAVVNSEAAAREINQFGRALISVAPQSGRWRHARARWIEGDGASAPICDEGWPASSIKGLALTALDHVLYQGYEP
jgi:hypothetical protein